mgnify:CR=1 FL=1
MPKIGLLKPIFAKITGEPENAAITYAAGKVLAHAIEAGVAYQKNDSPLYADNTIVENDTSVTGAEITLGLDDIAEADQVDLLGMVKTGTAGNEEYEVTSESAPYVGVGYVEVRKRNGVISYTANWFHKVLFGVPDESAKTKNEKLEWQTPTIKGKAMGVYLDDTGVLRYKISKPCTTLAAALTWLETKANITAGSGE